ncbi:MAG TPA: tRNA lysidine(34) synthetase TilS [Streptosporangiaceae bacterium]|nr:tRNA lysidine(34) synthetase TilS [Streptosporangiaceae bacterium]
MAGPHPAVAAIRLAVRAALAGLPPGDVVLAACSGGADSLALAAALAFEGPRLGLRPGGVTIDHGLQPGSAEQAGRVTGVLAGLGLDPVHAVRVTVARPGGAGGYPGPEAAARAARYAALDEIAPAPAAILLGHTLDDQAETVLLGLARGSGARALAGMAPVSGRYRRPLLGVRRAQTRAACAALRLTPWEDPHNSDPGYARVRVRRVLLPALEEQLGPGVAEALARTAGQLRADADALDELAAAAGRRMADGQPGLPAGALAAQPPAVRSRLLRAAALAAGAPAGALSHQHVTQMEALVTGWHGQRGVDLPGRIRCQRRYDRLIFAAGPRTRAPGAIGELSGRD